MLELAGGCSRPVQADSIAAAIKPAMQRAVAA
jgi:hypothetical protein